MIFEFHLISTPIFCILGYRLLTVCFIWTFFFTNTKILPIKLPIGFSKDVQFFLLKVSKFQIVTIFSLQVTLYHNHLCFAVMYQSNLVLLKVSINLCTKVYFCLSLVWWTKPKFAWRHNFFDGNLYYYRDTSCFVLKIWIF